MAEKDLPVRNIQNFTYPNCFHKEISRGTPFKKQIALTFDGGSGRSCVSDILDQLSKSTVPLTAFLTGEFIRRHSRDVQLLAEYGAEVGNHSLTHPWLAKEETWRTANELTSQDFQTEIATTAKLYQDAIGAPMAPLWRAPYGSRSLEILEWGSSLGLTHVHWTYDTADWRIDLKDPLSQSGTKIVQNLLGYESLAPHGLCGAIILLHLGAQRREDPLAPHLHQVCEELKQLGYAFVRISDLLQARTHFEGVGDLSTCAPLQLPIRSGAVQVGGCEDFYSDGWIGPRFAARIAPAIGSKTLKIELYLPELLEHQDVSVLVNGVQVASKRLSPGKTTRLCCPAPADLFTLDIHSTLFACPNFINPGTDKRYLCAIMTEIALDAE